MMKGDFLPPSLDLDESISKNYFQWNPQVQREKTPFNYDMHVHQLLARSLRDWVYQKGNQS